MQTILWVCPGSPGKVGWPTSPEFPPAPGGRAGLCLCPCLCHRLPERVRPVVLSALWKPPAPGLGFPGLLRCPGLGEVFSASTGRLSPLHEPEGPTTADPSVYLGHLFSQCSGPGRRQLRSNHLVHGWQLLSLPQSSASGDRAQAWEAISQFSLRPQAMSWWATYVVRPAGHTGVFGVGAPLPASPASSCVSHKMAQS